MTLAALTKKVQWDVKSRTDFPIPRVEKDAFSKLKVELKDGIRPAVITGPLRSEGGVWVMEVRNFSWK